ncbi:TadE/TadG family type IV pilus assembly protein [Tranquillimonas alkanivorans]|uniref:TadE-like protein n=1 Tax=Tranquillimonas alkanivorans TaxID=441119 RepID=A0A1I5S625_9RHOB|nr:TadE family protein [Tranquillimonas alkanivorans]SFP66172.1 TadE-like protein [Tranquillimonas alkanivorans]
MTRRFLTETSGSSTVEFVILFPVLMALFMLAFELGLLGVRDVMLQRATDLTVRDLRLSTGNAPSYESIRDRICDRALIIPECQSSLRIEMQPVPASDWANIAGDAKCVDRSAEVKPANVFVPGQENELMLIRICALFDPIFPTTGLAYRLPKNGQGEYGIQANAAFVTEPQ